VWKFLVGKGGGKSKLKERHARATSHMSQESRDLVMVRTLDSHPKAIPWVLGKLFYVVRGPRA